MGDNAYCDGNAYSNTNDNTARYSYSTAPSDTGASSVTVRPKEVLTRELASKNLASSLA